MPPLSAGGFFFVVRHWRAGADEVAIAVHIVDSADGREVLDRIAHLRVRADSELSRVSSRGVVAEDRIERMRSVVQRVVVRWPFPGFDLLELAVDQLHCAAEAIEFVQRFAFGRLDHQRAANREGHGRCMEAEVDQTLGDIVDRHVGLLVERSGVDDALVSDKAAVTGVENLVVLLQAMSDVIGVEDGDLGCHAEAFGTHHPNVHPGDGQDAGAAERCGADERPGAAGVDSVLGEERSEVGANADWSDAWSTTTVRDAERLMQVEVRDIAAKLAWLSDTDEGIEVRTVDVDLTTCVVDLFADRRDAIFEDAVGRRIGDHDRRDLAFVIGDFVIEVSEIDVAVVIAFDDDDFHVDHLSAGGVGAVGAAGDQADIAMVIASRLVILLDSEQSSVLALRSGVGLQGDRIVAGAGTEPTFQLVDHHTVAGPLVGRGVGMNAVDFGPSDRGHFAGRIQLHRAGPKRDHRSVECDIHFGEPAEVTHQLGFAAVAVEDLLGQDSVLALEFIRQVRVLGGARSGGAKELCQRGDIGFGRSLVAGDAELRGAEATQVETSGDGGGGNAVRFVPDIDHNRIEELFTGALLSGRLEGVVEFRGSRVDSLGDGAETFWAVVDGIEGGHDGEQGLSRADIRGRFLATDMLLAGLQREPESGLAVRIDRLADEAAGHHPLEGVASCHEGGVGTAESERHAEPLRVANGDVRAHVTGRLEQHQREQVGGYDCQGVIRVRIGDQLLVIADRAIGGGILENQAEDVGPVADAGSLVK